MRFRSNPSMAFNRPRPFPLVALLLAGVLSAEACTKNSDCDMTAGEWCGSCGGDGDTCCSGPCDITKSSAHSCLTCSLAFKEPYPMTDDCECLASPDALAGYGGKCYSGLGEPIATPAEFIPDCDKIRSILQTYNAKACEKECTNDVSEASRGMYESCLPGQSEWGEKCQTQQCQDHLQVIADSFWDLILCDATKYPFNAIFAQIPSWIGPICGVDDGKSGASGANGYPVCIYDCIDQHIVDGLLDCKGLSTCDMSTCAVEKKTDINMYLLGGCTDEAEDEDEDEDGDGDETPPCVQDCFAAAGHLWGQRNADGSYPFCDAIGECDTSECTREIANGVAYWVAGGCNDEDDGDDGGSQDGGRAAVDWPTCVSDCTSAPADCDALQEMMGEGGCATECSPHEAMQLVVRLSSGGTGAAAGVDYMDGACAAAVAHRYPYLAPVTEAAAQLFVDHIGQWPVGTCFADCAGVQPATCDDIYTMHSAEGCAPECDNTGKLLGGMAATYFGTVDPSFMFMYDCIPELNNLLTTEAPTAAPTEPPTEALAPAPTPAAADSGASGARPALAMAVVMAALALERWQ